MAKSKQNSMDFSGMELEAADVTTTGTLTSGGTTTLTGAVTVAGTLTASGDIVTGSEGGESVGSLGNRSRVELFDDFLGATIDTTDNWIVFEGSDGDATAAATVAGIPEGQIAMGSGGVGGANDKTVLSLILLAKGGLVSQGQLVFETRVTFDQITGTSWGFGFGDVLANATEVANYKVNSGTITDDAGITNAVSFVFSTDATATTKWQACSTNGGTVGNAAAEEALTAGPTALTYQVLRIEVDATGDARFYVDGTLQTTTTTAVATTSLLIPYIWGDSGDDADVATDVHIDYIYFSQARDTVTTS